jgi:hypothetical protein
LLKRGCNKRTKDEHYTNITPRFLLHFCSILAHFFVVNFVFSDFFNLAFSNAVKNFTVRGVLLIDHGHVMHHTIFLAI